jgi:type I restriction enzyme S subunit
MSKLNELIEKLCPNGVKYNEISELCKVTRGRVISKEDIKENIGDYPVYSSQTENNGELGKISTYDYNGEYLTWTTDGAKAGSVFYRNGKFNITNVCGLLKVTNTKILAKFLYYILSIEAPKYVNKGMGNPKLMSNVMSKIKIPVPPLEIQSEIVDILDKFTDSLSKLKTLLKAELKARKKQYAYYRERILENNDTKKVRLGDCLLKVENIKWKQTNESHLYIDLSSVNREKHRILETTEINNTNAPSRAQQIIKKDDVLFGGTRPMLKRSCLVEECYDNEICSTGFCVLRANQSIVLPKWIYYMINTDNFYEYVEKNQQGASYPAISDSVVKDYEISLPTLEEQKKLVELLDKFERYVFDLSEGIPAEIEARQKQYEYYRDKLLTFKELEK